MARNPEYHRKWREANKDRLNAAAKIRRAKRREQENEYHRNWRKNNPDKVRLINVLYKYGISAEDYKALLEKQNNKCAICFTDFDNAVKKTTAHVDHSHSNDIVRGLLCDWCNKGLGNFEDDMERLNRAVSYLANKESEI